MLSPTTRPALSERLRVSATDGLLRLNATLGTCYPVVGVQSYGQPVQANGEGLHFRIDPVALTASAAPASAPAPDLAAEAARAEAGMGWLLYSLLGLLALTCLL